MTPRLRFFFAASEAAGIAVSRSGLQAGVPAWACRTWLPLAAVAIVALLGRLGGRRRGGHGRRVLGECRRSAACAPALARLRQPSAGLRPSAWAARDHRRRHAPHRSAVRTRSTSSSASSYVVGAPAFAVAGGPIGRRAGACRLLAVAATTRTSAALCGRTVPTARRATRSRQRCAVAVRGREVAGRVDLRRHGSRCNCRWQLVVLVVGHSDNPFSCARHEGRRRDDRRRALQCGWHRVRSNAWCARHRIGSIEPVVVVSAAIRTRGAAGLRRRPRRRRSRGHVQSDCR